MWFVVIGVGVGMGLFLLSRHARAQTVIGISHEDVEYLARMIVLERSNGTEEEIAGIAWVALNRLAGGRHGSTVREVVSASNWNTSERYRRIIQSDSGYTEDGRSSPVDHARFDEILEFMFLLARGEVPNPIGSRMHFLHPQALRDCSIEGSREGSYECRDGKLFPLWALPEYAVHEPMMIGITLFS